MSKSRTELLTNAATIKNETTAAANTATRIGTMFEDIVYSTNNTNYTYFARLSQSSTSAPAVQRVFTDNLSVGVPGDLNYTAVVYTRNSPGDYKIKIRSAVSSSKVTDGYSYAVSFSDAKVRMVSYTNGTDGSYPPAQYFTEFNIRSYNTSGSLSDDVINFTNVLIQYYEW
jgi:hypothetical protein